MSRLSASALFIAVSGLAFTARTSHADTLDRLLEEVSALGQQAQGLGPHYLQRGESMGAQYVAKRLIEGENIYRMRDYERATIIFMDIIENHSNHTAYPDALFLYADCLFLSNDFIGARSWFEKFLKMSHLPGAGRYKEKAVARLIEIAIHLDDYEEVEEYVKIIGQYPSDESRYVRGKYLFFRGDYEGAKQLFQSITTESELKYKALYMLGVAFTQQGSYDEAIKVFLAGLKIEPSTKTEREIVDLMKLGAGRLYYEQGLLTHATEIYEQISQNSRYFDAALYEGASVLIQAGDTLRAEQALEVLTITVPESQYLPKAKMLRGNLLLRAGRYKDAERVFDELVKEFTPLMNQLEQVIREQKNTQKFFFDIVERSMMTLDVSTALPDIVVKWVGEEPEVQRALTLAKDLGSAKGNVRETERLARLMATVLDGPSRINAVPMLREGMRRSQQILNRLAQLRGELSVILEEEAGSEIPAILQLSQERRQVRQLLSKLPTTKEEFKTREAQTREIFSRMKNELQRNAIRLDQLNAMTVAIERFVQDPKYAQEVPPTSLRTAVSETLRHRAAVQKMQGDLDDLRIDVERAGYEVGVGDKNDAEDWKLRKRAMLLSRRERQLIQPRKRDDVARIDSGLETIHRIEQRLGKFQGAIRATADQRVAAVLQQVLTERNKIEGYYSELSSLGKEAETVVAGVAFENFSSVRKRFHELILKADVGIIDSAWLRKEFHTTRISDLTNERLKNIRRLDEEFRGVSPTTTEQLGHE